MVSAVGLLLLLSGCIRDELAPCPPLGIRLEVEDKNYINVKAANRLGLEEIRSEQLPFSDYVSTLYYRLSDAETGRVVLEQPLTAVQGQEESLLLPVPESLPFGRYVLTAWGNLTKKGSEQLGDDPEQLKLHPDRLPGNDIYLASDTLLYNENDYSYTLGMKRVKGKLIVMVEEMPDAFGYSEKSVSAISGRVDHRFNYADSLSLSFATVWPKRHSMITKQLLAPSTGPSESLFKIRFYVGEGPEKDNWIAPENVSITLEQNKLTVLRYIYDPCCCRFKIYVLINDNWETLHIMEVE